MKNGTKLIKIGPDGPLYKNGHIGIYTIDHEFHMVDNMGVYISEWKILNNSEEDITTKKDQLINKLHELSDAIKDIVKQIEDL